MAENGHINANGNVVKVGPDGVAYPWLPSKEDIDQRAIDELNRIEAINAPKPLSLEERVSALEVFAGLKV